MIPARGLASAPRNDGVEIVDSSPLPIDAALPELTAALRASNAAVLVAPPGAGKTTRVPLVLAGQPWAQASGSSRRILVLEPRRLAARAAAARMAHNLNEAVGETVGLRVRFGSKISRKTRIEIVTEGIFTRMIVEQHCGDAREHGIIDDHARENAFGDDLDAGLARDFRAEAHAQTHGFADRFVKVMRHARGGGARGEPARLEHQDAP